jgi:sugar-specific transcriptional regulator TrmB
MIDVEELKKSLYGSLQELGLHEAEALLYMTSLALGPTTIAELSTHLGIARPNVYKVVVELIW